MSRRPHKLDLYRLAVQNPVAEATFLLRAYTHANRGQGRPTVLKEDFAGSAVLATMWAMMDVDHQAVAVDNHAATIRWARSRSERELGRRAKAVRFRQSDVLDARAPKADIIAALNFSTFIYHDRPSLERYFKAARRSLKPGGVLVIDAYGGPGAMRMGIQSRRIAPPAEENIRPFVYQWEQKSYDAATGRIDCRIHFKLHDGSTMPSAFRYDWRLWTLPELREAMQSAGFGEVTIWCDRVDAAGGRADGVFRPVKHMAAREDWIAYVVGA